MIRWIEKRICLNWTGTFVGLVGIPSIYFMYIFSQRNLLFKVLDSLTFLFIFECLIAYRCTDYRRNKQNEESDTGFLCLVFYPYPSCPFQNVSWYCKKLCGWYGMDSNELILWWTCPQILIYNCVDDHSH